MFETGATYVVQNQGVVVTYGSNFIFAIILYLLIGLLILILINRINI